MRFLSVLRRPAGLEVHLSLGPMASESQVPASADIGRRNPTDRNQSRVCENPLTDPTRSV